MAGKYLDGTGLSQVWEAVKNRTSQTLTAAKNYTDTKIAALVNSAPETLDTLAELAAAFTENKEITDALNEAIGNKANKTDLDNYVKYGDISNPSTQTIYGGLSLGGALQLGYDGAPMVTFNRDGSIRVLKPNAGSSNNSVYDILLPEKSGTLATLDDIPTSLEGDYLPTSGGTIEGDLKIENQLQIGDVNTGFVRTQDGLVLALPNLTLYVDSSLENQDQPAAALKFPEVRGTLAITDDIPVSLTAEEINEILV